MEMLLGTALLRPPSIHIKAQRWSEAINRYKSGFTRNGVVCLSNASFNFRKAAGGSLTRQVSPLLTFYRLFFIFTFCFVDKLLSRELEMAKQLLKIKILHRLELVFVSRQRTILSDGRQSLSGAFQSRK